MPMWANLPASKVEQITFISRVEIVTHICTSIYSSCQDTGGQRDYFEGPFEAEDIFSFQRLIYEQIIA